MVSDELNDLISESRALRRELRLHLDARKSFAKHFREDLETRALRPVRIGDIQICHMTSLIFEAHKIAVREENGLTVDILNDALLHLHERLEREVLAHEPRLGTSQV